MQKYCWILFVFLFLPNAAIAQTGTCEPGLAQSILNAGNVQARITNHGGLFWPGPRPRYEVPKGSGIEVVSGASIWVAGMIENDLRVAASRYGPFEFWPGPLDEAGHPPASCKPYDKIWEIRTEDLTDFKSTGVISTNLESWPWHLGAPVVDGDGVPGNYNLASGDLPELFGDQRLWWIMNDRGNAHEATDSDPIGLEVHASAHAFDHPGFVANSTFYNYKLINKNTAPLEHAFFGVYSDTDVGNFDDDYLGSDSLLHLTYVYNEDNDDEGLRGYGTAPPAVGFTIIESVPSAHDAIDNDRDGTIDEPGEKMGAYGAMHYTGAGGSRIDGDAGIGPDYYAYLQTYWLDKSPLYRGLKGLDWSNFPEYAHLAKTRTRFVFSGDPVTRSFWSMMNVDDRGGTFSAGDINTLISLGPLTLAPQDTVEIRFAIVWARGNDHLDSVTELKKDVREIQRMNEAFYSPGRIVSEPQPPLRENFVLGFDQNFPNPFIQSTTLRYSLPQKMRVRLAVYDMLGREVALLVDGQKETGIHTAEFDGSNLPAGIYLARLEVDFLQFTKQMVLIR
ncbi:MAG: T9SS type A sorting domain-containing protein [Bacteroidota bacterium]